MKPYPKLPRILVDESGKIFSNKTKKQLKTCINKYGYERIATVIGSRTDGSRKTLNLKVHRIIAETYIPNPNKYETVNHKDGNKLNNKVENLEWLSFANNTRHAYENGLINIQKMVDTKSIPVIGINDKDEFVYFRSMKLASKQLKLHITSIWASVVGKTHTSGGYKWFYCTEPVYKESL